MGVYIVNIILLIAEGLWLLYQNPSEKNKKRFCVMASVQWILISGLRHISVGADTVNYKVWFDRTANYSWQTIITLFKNYITQEEDVKAPGFTLLIKLFQYISTNYQWFLIFIAVLFFTTMGRSIYRYSKNPCLSYILFSCLFFSFFAITGHRQTVATALVVFCGLELIRKRKLIPFILVTLAAFLIHKSAVCLLPFYWLSRIRIKRTSIIAYWAAILLAFRFRYQFLAILQFIVGYDSYLNNIGARAGTFMFLLLLAAAFVSVFHRAIMRANTGESGKLHYGGNALEYRENNDLTQISVNALFIACIFSPLLLINQNTMRVVQYYSLFLMFLLPECSKAFINRRSMWLFNAIVSVILIALLMKNDPQYLFFWQN